VVTSEDLPPAAGNALFRAKIRPPEARERRDGTNRRPAGSLGSAQHEALVRFAAGAQGAGDQRTIEVGSGGSSEVIFQRTQSPYPERFAAARAVPLGSASIRRAARPSDATANAPTPATGFRTARFTHRPRAPHRRVAGRAAPCPRSVASACAGSAPERRISRSRSTGRSAFKCPCVIFGMVEVPRMTYARRHRVIHRSH